MTIPSVAVVIPCYNRGRFIEETLRSAFRQTLQPREVRVIDDGSADDSIQAIERAFAKAGPIPCSLTARENRGISVTRNELVAATASDFVAFLDSDDLYAPRRLARMLENAPRGDPYFAFSGVEVVSELGPGSVDEWHEMYHMKLGQAMSFPTAGFAMARFNVAITASNFVVSRSLFDSIGGFDSRVKLSQDWDFAVQSLQFVEPTFIPEPLLTYRLHSQNTSRDNQEAVAQEQEVVIDKYQKWLLRPTVNLLAPTPRNWPRYFRVFANVCTYHDGRSLAARLPPETLAISRAAAATERETRAIRDLVAAALRPESIHELSRFEIMRRCQLHWEQGS